MTRRPPSLREDGASRAARALSPLALAAALLLGWAAPAAASDFQVRETRRIVWHYVEPWTVTEDDLALMDDHVERIAGQLRMDPGEKIHVYKYPDVASVLAHTGVDWEAFVRDGEVHTVFTWAVPHEVVHVLLGRLNPDGVGVMNEGLALLLGDQGMLGRLQARPEDREWPLEREARELDTEGRFVPLASVLGLRSLRGELQGGEVWPAYIQGASFTQYLVETFGMTMVVEAYRQATPETAVTVLPEVFGVPLEELEAGWLDWLRSGGRDLRRYALVALAAVFAYVAGRWLYRFKFVRLRTVARAAPAPPGAGSGAPAGLPTGPGASTAGGSRTFGGYPGSGSGD